MHYKINFFAITVIFTLTILTTIAQRSNHQYYDTTIGRNVNSIGRPQSIHRNQHNAYYYQNQQNNGGATYDGRANYDPNISYNQQQPQPPQYDTRAYHYEQPTYEHAHHEQPNYLNQDQNQYVPQTQDVNAVLPQTTQYARDVNIPTPPQYPPNSLQYKVQQQLNGIQLPFDTTSQPAHKPYSSFFSKLALFVVITAMIVLILLKYCLFIRKRSLENQLLGTKKFTPTALKQHQAAQRQSSSPFSSPTERIRLLNAQNHGHQLPPTSSGLIFYKKFFKKATLLEKINFYTLIAIQWTIVFITQRFRSAGLEELLLRVRFQDQKLLANSSLSPSTSTLDKHL